MKKFLLAVMAMLAFSSAMADVNTSGLTEKQKAELALQAAKMKEEAGAPAQTVVQQATSVNDAAAEGVRKWGSVSTEVAKGLVVGLAAAAKEANIAVNDFAVTPVGRITTAIIVWKMIGHDLTRALGGLLMIFLVAPTVWHVYKRITTDITEWETKPFLWGFWQRQVAKRAEHNTGDGFLTFVFIVLGGLSIIAGMVLLVA